MPALRTLRSGFERLMEALVILLMAVLALEVTAGVVFRTLGHPLVWYDEIASVLLAWVTYYGAALAALKRSHIGFAGLIRSLPPGPRLALTLFGEACVFAFFGLLGWVGYSILDVLATDFLVSLPEISVEWTQSVIPIGAALYIIAEALILPDLIREALGRSAAADHTAEEMTE